MSGPWRCFPATLLVAGFFLLLAGCATTRPMVQALPAEEEQAVRQEAARLYVAAEDACSRCLDVEAQVVVQSLLQSGTVPGYLLAKPPGFVKFVGLSPLGQPLLALATDGSSFRFVAVVAATAYEGTTTASAFRKHAPAGLDPEASFFWLIGRLPKESRISAVSRDESGGYWLTVANGREGRHLVLFDREQGVITQALLLDQEERPQLEVQYAEYQSVTALGGEAGCRLPGTVIIKSSQQGGAVLTVRFSNWLLGSACNDADFSVPLPPGFALEKVE